MYRFIHMAILSNLKQLQAPFKCPHYTKRVTFSLLLKYSLLVYLRVTSLDYWDCKYVPDMGRNSLDATDQVIFTLEEVDLKAF